MGTVNLSKVTVNLTKGDVVNLSKQSAGLKKVIVALGWDENKGKTRTVTETVQPGLLGRLFGAQPKEVTRKVETSQYDFDLDAWVCLLKDGNVAPGESIVYYGYKDARDNNGNTFIHHCGDNLTGEGEGDDEQIIINLDKIPSDYNGIVVGVTIYKGYSRDQTFGDIDNMFVRVVDTNDNFEICRYSDSIAQEYKNCYTFIAGKLYKDKGEWHFKSAGYGTQDKSIESAVHNYKG